MDFIKKKRNKSIELGKMGENGRKSRIMKNKK